MQLIKGAKTWWRWWSTWITAVGLLIFNIDTIGALLDAYNAIPHDFTATFSEETRRILGTEPLEPLLQYTQALRDVPQQAGFPESVEWPQCP